MLRLFIAVFLGGGIGSAMRYGIQTLIHQHITPGHFPWSTFTVNIAGSFLIGLFYTLSDRYSLPAEVRLLLTAGLCGGFTTFSTFSIDILGMIRQGYTALALIYVAASIILGLGACFLGSVALSSARMS